MSPEKDESGHELSKNFQHYQLEHEAAWCSTFSCLETSQTGDSSGFQLSLSQNQIDLQMSVFIDSNHFVNSLGEELILLHLVSPFMLSG
ncbi:hypothetical protein CSKR_105818 [Clonorchis sinensis]|uniref:Uncharacterized protein n=1 Tax=Clonorchis sinensis TaxID=79923 RepID=A0A3R7JJD0_CLOSI|nr:hypothetical protein CSKR_105818 [Clonorchis sinensis]